MLELNFVQLLYFEEKCYMLHSYCSTEARRIVPTARVQCDSPVRLKTSSRWIFLPTLVCRSSDNVQYGRMIKDLVPLRCLFSSWAISCSRSPIGRSCSHKYWGCKVHCGKWEDIPVTKGFIKETTADQGAKFAELSDLKFPVVLLLLLSIYRCYNMILQVCITNQGFTVLHMELYYVYLTKLSRSLIVVRAALRRSVCLWTW
jgi:hypothetical protein